MKIINVMASSLDGKIGIHPSESDEERREYGFVSQEDKEFVRSQLENCDAVITGAQSLRASGKIWALPGLNGKYPDWFIYTNRGLEKELGFWKQKEVRRVLVSESAVRVEDPSVENLVYGSGDKVSKVLEVLKSSGKKRVLLFGGGFINSMFYQAGVVDELWLTVCPIIVGDLKAPKLVNEGLVKPVMWKLNSVESKGNHVFVNYWKA